MLPLVGNVWGDGVTAAAEATATVVKSNGHRQNRGFRLLLARKTG
jgi:hypothetical protein